MAVGGGNKTGGIRAGSGGSAGQKVGGNSGNAGGTKESAGRGSQGGGGGKPADMEMNAPASDASRGGKQGESDPQKNQVISPGSTKRGADQASQRSGGR